MALPEPANDVRQARLAEAVAAYRSAVDAGQNPSPRMWAACYPEVAEELKQFFEEQGHGRACAAPLRTVVPSPPAAAESTTPGQSAASEPAASTDRPCFGDYELLETIGIGGVGIVWKARQVSLNRTVALKMIRRHEFVSVAAVERFRTEAEAVASLDHPNIVPIFEVGECHGQQFFSMKLIDGGSLARYLAESASICPLLPEAQRRAARLVTTVAWAVHYAHQRGILHRDLKPDNILLDSQGQPHVADFGLAKKLLTSGTDDSPTETRVVDHAIGTNQTHQGAVRGTPSYMAPEQAAGTRSLTTAVDVYGVGAILYQLLTGRPVFTGTTSHEILRRVRDETPDRPSQVNAGVDPDLEAICLKCLSKDPAARYSSARALAEDLEHWLAGEPVAARPIGTLRRAAKWARRQPMVAGLGAAVVLALIASVIGMTYGVIEATRQRSEQVLRRQAERDRDAAEAARAETVVARDGEKRARIAAEKARDDEARAREAAESARNALATAQEKLARVEYGRTIQVAHQYWRYNNIAGARELLDRTRKDLRGWEWAYVHRLCHTDLLTLKGHAGYLSSASFNRDGSRIVTGSWDKTAKVWDTKTGEVITTLNGHRGVVHSAAFSADGSRIVTGSWDKTAKVWDAKTGEVLLTLKGHTFAVNSVAFSADGSRIVTGSTDMTARVWGAKTGGEVLLLNGRNGQVFSAAFSPDGSRIVTANSVGLAQVFDSATGGELLTLKGHNTMGNPNWVRSAAFSADGSRIVTGSWDKTAKVWDAKTGEVLLTLNGHTDSVYFAAFSADGSRIVTGSADRTAKLWDAKTGDELRTIRGHTGTVYSASFGPDGSRIVTGSWDNTAKVWDENIGAEPLTITGHHGLVFSARFSPDGARIVTASTDGSAKVWDAKTGTELFTLKEPTGQVVSASFSADGSRILTGSKTARVWDAKTGDVLLTLKAHCAFGSGAFSPDGTRIVTAMSDKTAKVWDAKTGDDLLTLKGHTQGVNKVLFSADGLRILTASSDGTARVWDAKTDAEILVLRGHSSFVYSASFNSDASRILTASHDTTARVWDAKTGTTLFTLTGHFDAVRSASFSADGSRIVTASWDGTTKVWDAATGADVLTLDAANKVHSAEFSADGWRIVTQRLDGITNLWDAEPVNREFCP